MGEPIRIAAAERTPRPNRAEKSRGRLGWWPRHQAHETTVYRWDLASVTGQYVAIDAWLGAGGIGERQSHRPKHLDGEASDLMLLLWRRLP
jgi:hypothetical protein